MCKHLERSHLSPLNTTDMQKSDVFPSLSKTSDLQQNSPLRLLQTSPTMSADQQPPSPLTPASTFKAHARFPSSASSCTSSPSMRASMESHVSRRRLAQLKEDPQERDAEVEMIDAFAEGPASPAEEAFTFTSEPDLYYHDSPPADYDWVDSAPYGHSDLKLSLAKRRRGDASTFPPFSASRITARLPTFARRWRSKSEKRTSPIADSFQEAIASRSRASSMRSITVPDMDHGEVPPLPTPAQSFILEDYIDVPSSPMSMASRIDDIEEQDNEEGEAEAIARTPLLPPVLAIRPTEEPVQSPLQSPKVVESPVTSRNPFDSPCYTGLPSPPLSTKPSVASFHHRQIPQQSEIPPIALSEPQDEWAIKLGHANFKIEPEPYPPLEPTMEACKQLKAKWELADREFAKHLACVRANYSTSSKVHHLTEEKWAATSQLWTTYHEQALDAARGQETEAEALSLQPSLHEPVPITKLPTLNGPAEKFPVIADCGIVGPMEQAKPLAQQSAQSQVQVTARRKPKRAFWRFLQDLLPSNLVRAQA